MRAIIFDLDHTLFNAEQAVHSGTHELLAILQRLGLKIAGITNGDHHMLVRLDEAGLRKFFTTVLCTDQIASPKIVTGIEHVLAMVGAAPGEAVMVSHAYSDILLGRDAGLAKTIAVSHGSGNLQPLQHAGADHIVQDIPGVLDVLA